MQSYKCASPSDKGTTLGDGDRIPCGRIRHSNIYVMLVNM